MHRGGASVGCLGRVPWTVARCSGVRGVSGGWGVAGFCSGCWHSVAGCYGHRRWPLLLPTSDTPESARRTSERALLGDRSFNRWRACVPVAKHNVRTVDSYELSPKGPGSRGSLDVLVFSVLHIPATPGGCPGCVRRVLGSSGGITLPSASVYLIFRISASSAVNFSAYLTKKP